MTKLLETAFAETAKLSEHDQDALPQWLLQELASERRWDDIVSRSHDGIVFAVPRALGRTSRPHSPNIAKSAQRSFTRVSRKTRS